MSDIKGKIALVTGSSRGIGSMGGKILYKILANLNKYHSLVEIELT